MQLRHHLDEVPKLVMKVIAADGGQTEEISPLADEDDHTDASRETHDHGRRDELDDATQTGNSHQYQHDPRHERGDLQSCNAVLGSNAGQNDNEGAGRTRDLQPTATQDRDQPAADDRRV